VSSHALFRIWLIQPARTSVSAHSKPPLSVIFLTFLREQVLSELVLTLCLGLTPLHMVRFAGKPCATAHSLADHDLALCASPYPIRHLRRNSSLRRTRAPRPRRSTARLIRGNLDLYWAFPYI